MPQQRLGITFSHIHLRHLGIEPTDALGVALSFGFSHIRLGNYWDITEKSKGVYDFSAIQAILDICEKNNQPIIMVVGMKAPRWPEFHIPSYIKSENINDSILHERALVFIEKCLIALRRYACITHWQVENEPLDPSGPRNLSIPLGVLQKEVELVKRLDSRPVILTAWGNDIVSRRTLSIISPLADLVGIDLYYKQYSKTLFGLDIYTGPHSSEDVLRDIINTSEKPIIITELQAEPWERNEERYLANNPHSISAQIVRNNIAKAHSLGVNKTILWGFEYWYYQMKKGNDSYIKTVSEYMR